MVIGEVTPPYVSAAIKYGEGPDLPTANPHFCVANSGIVARGVTSILLRVSYGSSRGGKRRRTVSSLSVVHRQRYLVPATLYCARVYWFPSGVSLFL